MPYALCWGCRRHICLKCDAERIRTGKCDVIENKLDRLGIQRPLPPRPRGLKSPPLRLPTALKDEGAADD